MLTLLNYLPLVSNETFVIVASAAFFAVRFYENRIVLKLNNRKVDEIKKRENHERKQLKQLALFASDQALINHSFVMMSNGVEPYERHLILTGILLGKFWE